MKHTLVKLRNFGLVSIIAAAIAGCGGGGGSDGAPGASGTTTVVTAPSNGGTGGTNITSLAPASFANLSLDSSNSSVSGIAIHSPPTITFTVLDGSGNGVTGLDKNYCTIAQANADGTTTTIKRYLNVAASIMKEMPATATAPGRWQPYMVANINSTTGALSIGHSTTDSYGTLTPDANVAGKYSYQFNAAHDIKNIATWAAAQTLSSTQKLSDLGDLSFDTSKLHRVIVTISGPAPNTGGFVAGSACSLSTATTQAQTPAQPLASPINIIQDFMLASDGAGGYSSTPATTTRDIVRKEACQSCHTKFTFHQPSPFASPDAAAAAGVGGPRQDPRACAQCHNDTLAFGQTDATRADGINGRATLTIGSMTGIRGFSGSGVDRLEGRSVYSMPSWIHTIHMGDAQPMAGIVSGGITINDVRYPQLITNCVKCHDGTGNATYTDLATGAAKTYKTAQGDNWKNAPNRLACGACHSGINFKDGTGVNVDGSTTGHTKGAIAASAIQTDDSNCKGCHSAAAIATVHIPVTPPDQANSLLLGGSNANTNAAYMAGDTSNLPAGAKVPTYKIKSVTLNSNRNPVISFQILLDGVAQTFNAQPSCVTFTSGTYGTGAVSSAAACSNFEMLPNFMGSPSAYAVWSVPQDGIAAPTDFNQAANVYIRSAWNGMAYTTIGSGASAISQRTATFEVDTANAGYYKVTLVGTVVPPQAVMLTGGIGLTYGVVTTLPLTQTNVVGYTPTAATATSGLTAGMPNKVGGLLVPAPVQTMVATSGCTASTSDSTICSSSGAFVGRRVTIDNNRCLNCHRILGPFNDSQFHAGQRNDGNVCAWCHTANNPVNGWVSDSTAFIHRIHGNGKRQSDGQGDVPGSQTFRDTWEAGTTTNPVAPVLTTTGQLMKPGTAAGTTAASACLDTTLSSCGTATTTLVEDHVSIGYPNLTKNCLSCHTAGSYDFSNATNAAQAARKLYRVATVGWNLGNGGVGNAPGGWSGTTCSTVSTSALTNSTLYGQSPWTNANAPAAQNTNFAAGTASFYGITFATNVSPYAAAAAKCNNTASGSSVILPAATATTSAAALTWPNDAASYFAYGQARIVSPMMAACSACHISNQAMSHMKTTGGGVYYQTRASVLGYTNNTSVSPPTATLPATIPSNPEQCLVCHGSGGVADIKAMHAFN